MCNLSKEWICKLKLLAGHIMKKMLILWYNM